MEFSIPTVGQLQLIGPGEPAPGAEDLRAHHIVEEMGYVSSRDQLADDKLFPIGYVLVKTADRCIALMRIIHGSPDGFELEHYIEPRDYVDISKRTIEISEMIVAPGDRGSITTMVLALGFCGYVKIHEPDVVIAGSTLDLAKVYTKLGMTVRQDIVYRGTWNTDLYFCFAAPASDLVDTLMKETPVIYRGFVNSFMAQVDSYCATSAPRPSGRDGE